jgi:hypothetical protein
MIFASFHQGKEENMFCLLYVYQVLMYSKSFSKLRANNDPGLSQLLIPSPASSFVPELLNIYSDDRKRAAGGIKTF